jgi:hypothetical protein
MLQWHTVLIKSCLNNIWVHLLVLIWHSDISARIWTRESQEPYSDPDIHGTWVADGTHQTSTKLLLAFKHLSHCGTQDCILAQKKCVPSVCSKEVTAGFVSASVSNHLPASCFVKHPKTLKLLGTRWPMFGHSATNSHKSRWQYGAQWFPSLWTP